MFFFSSEHDHVCRQKKKQLAAFLSFFELALEPANNDIPYCGCNLFNLKQFIDSSEAIDIVSRAVYSHTLLVTATNFQSWKCTPHYVLQTESVAKRFLDVPDEHFICENSNVFCPKSCNCFNHAGKLNSIIVDCLNRSLEEMPANISIPAKGGELIVNLKNNSINSFENCEDSKYTWLRHVTKLNLENNQGFARKYNHMMPTFLRCLEKVTHLYLAGNNIGYLPLLSLTKRSYTELSIANNPLKCDCKTTWLKDWLREKSKSVIDAESAHCEGKGEKLVRLEDCNKYEVLHVREIFCFDR